VRNQGIMESPAERTARAGADAARASASRRFLAWCVHAYTATGLVMAAGMAVLIIRGGPSAFRGVFLLMIFATLVDATDGSLARAVRVKEVLPHFDGRQLDYLVDFLTYVALPILLLWRGELLPAGQSAWLFAPLLAGAYWFCQVEAKTADGYFRGFPAYWNIVAFYLYAINYHVAPLPGWLTIGVLLLFSVLTCVPSRYLYPVHGGKLNLLSNVLAACWFVALVWIVFHLPSAASENDILLSLRRDTRLAAAILLSLSFPAYYMVASWVISWQRRRCS
jgi:phosphatidylcholine synthase